MGASPVIYVCPPSWHKTLQDQVLSTKEKDLSQRAKRAGNDRQRQEAEDKGACWTSLLW